MNLTYIFTFTYYAQCMDPQGLGLRFSRDYYIINELL